MPFSCPSKAIPCVADQAACDAAPTADATVCTRDDGGCARDLPATPSVVTVVTDRDVTVDVAPDEGPEEIAARIALLIGNRRCAT